MGEASVLYPSKINFQAGFMMEGVEESTRYAALKREPVRVTRRSRATEGDYFIINASSVSFEVNLNLNFSFPLIDIIDSKMMGA